MVVFRPQEDGALVAVLALERPAPRQGRGIAHVIIPPVHRFHSVMRAVRELHARVPRLPDHRLGQAGDVNGGDRSAAHHLLIGQRSRAGIITVEISLRLCLDGRVVSDTARIDKKAFIEGIARGTRRYRRGCDKAADIMIFIILFADLIKRDKVRLRVLHRIPARRGPVPADVLRLVEPRHVGDIRPGEGCLGNGDPVGPRLYGQLVGPGRKLVISEK